MFRARKAIRDVITRSFWLSNPNGDPDRMNGLRFDSTKVAKWHLCQRLHAGTSHELGLYACPNPR